MSSGEGGRSPSPLAVMTTEPVEVDQETVTGVLGWKPLPVTVTMVPGGPSPGLSTSVGTRACDVGVVVGVVDVPGVVVGVVLVVVWVVVVVGVVDGGGVVVTFIVPEIWAKMLAWR